MNYDCADFYNKELHLLGDSNVVVSFNSYTGFANESNHEMDQHVFAKSR